jgi:hypothetical protein
MEGLGEITFSILVAAIAEAGLFLYQQSLVVGCSMWRMATNATDASSRVIRALEVGALMRVLVASKAALVGLLRGNILESKDLGFVAATVDVRRTCAMAGLTTMEVFTLGSIVQAEVWRAVDVLELSFVTTLTGFGANKLCGLACGSLSGAFALSAASDKLEKPKSAKAVTTNTTGNFLRVRGSLILAPR